MHIVRQSFTATRGTQTSKTVTCGAGETAISGGFDDSLDVHAAYVEMLASYPPSANQWTVVVGNTGGNYDVTAAFAIAVCAKAN